MTDPKKRESRVDAMLDREDDTPIMRIMRRKIRLAEQERSALLAHQQAMKQRGKKLTLKSLIKKRRSALVGNGAATISTPEEELEEVRRQLEATRRELESVKQELEAVKQKNGKEEEEAVEKQVNVVRGKQVPKSTVMKVERGLENGHGVAKGGVKTRKVAKAPGKRQLEDELEELNLEEKEKVNGAKVANMLAKKQLETMEIDGEEVVEEDEEEEEAKVVKKRTVTKKLVKKQSKPELRVSKRIRKSNLK